MGVKARSISCCLVRRTWRQKERKNKRGLRGVNTACLVHTARGIPADVLPLMLTSSALALWVPDQTQIGLQTISSGCPKIHAGKTCSRLPWSAVVGRRVLRNFTYKLSRLITLGCSRLINYQSDRQAQSENLSGIGTYWNTFCQKVSCYNSRVHWLPHDRSTPGFGGKLGEPKGLIGRHKMFWPGEVWTAVVKRRANSYHWLCHVDGVQDRWQKTDIYRNSRM